MDEKLRAALAQERKAGFAAIDRLRARLAEVEAQRDMLKRVIIFIREECDWEPTWYESGGDERIGDVIRDALAKLEVNNGK